MTKTFQLCFISQLLEEAAGSMMKKILRSQLGSVGKNVSVIWQSRVLLIMLTLDGILQTLPHVRLKR